VEGRNSKRSNPEISLLLKPLLLMLLVVTAYHVVKNGHTIFADGDSALAGIYYSVLEGLKNREPPAS
jgi:hypothetical protein